MSGICMETAHRYGETTLDHGASLRRTTKDAQFSEAGRVDDGRQAGCPPGRATGGSNGGDASHGARSCGRVRWTEKVDSMTNTSSFHSPVSKTRERPRSGGDTELSGTPARQMAGEKRRRRQSRCGPRQAGARTGRFVGQSREWLVASSIRAMRSLRSKRRRFCRPLRTWDSAARAVKHGMRLCSRRPATAGRGARWRQPEASREPVLEAEELKLLSRRAMGEGLDWLVSGPRRRTVPYFVTTSLTPERIEGPGLCRRPGPALQEMEGMRK